MPESGKHIYRLPPENITEDALIAFWCGEGMHELGHVSTSNTFAIMFAQLYRVEPDGSLSLLAERKWPLLGARNYGSAACGLSRSLVSYAQSHCPDINWIRVVNFEDQGRVMAVVNTNSPTAQLSSATESEEWYFMERSRIPEGWYKK